MKCDDVCAVPGARPEVEEGLANEHPSLLSYQLRQGGLSATEKQSQLPWCHML